MRIKVFVNEKCEKAIIDISVICMRCENVLYSGSYYPGVIGKLNRKGDAL